jgi:hypothetical protein
LYIGATVTDILLRIGTQVAWPKLLDVHLEDTDYMIKNIADVLDKSKSTPNYYEIQLYSYEYNHKCNLILDKYKWIDSDTNEPFYALYLEIGDTIMPTFAIHPKDMSNANGFIYTLETYFQHLYTNHYLKRMLHLIHHDHR